MKPCKPFPRPCRKCEKRFQPTGRGERLCLECWKNASRRNKGCTVKPSPRLKIPWTRRTIIR